MTMTADGRTVEAELQERGAAREAYDRAIAAGQRASIAEEERPDVFTMRVGNILPGERVTVELPLVGPLPYEDGAATFRFPLVVAPRYIPGDAAARPAVGDGHAPDTDAVPDASRITPPGAAARLPATRCGCRSASTSTRPGSSSARCGPACTRSSARAATLQHRARASAPTATSSCDCRTRGADPGRGRACPTTRRATRARSSSTVLPPARRRAAAAARTWCCCSTAPAAWAAGRWWPPGAPRPAWSTR